MEMNMSGQGELNHMMQQLINGLEMEMKHQSVRSIGEKKVSLMVFEAFFLRVSGWVSLTVMICETKTDELDVTLVGSGGGGGFLNGTLGVHKAIIKDAVKLLTTLGFNLI